MFSQHRFRESEEDKKTREVLQKHREAGDQENKDEFNEFQKALERHNASKREALAVQKLISKGKSDIIVRTDLEKVAKKTKTDIEATRKPVFLTKEEREKQALERLQQKHTEAQKQNKDLDRARVEFERRERNERRAEKDRRNERKEERELSKKEREQQRERDLIKEAYLGKKKRKKVVIPPSQKFKFSFDWEACEDTSVEHNTLYDMRHKISMQYGRGFMAGIDRREQRKNNQFYDELIKDRDHGRTDSLIRELHRKRDKDEREAEKKKRSTLASTDWKMKHLDDMGDRDWRMLKEDCKIVYNTMNFNGQLPNPLRKWREAVLSDPLEMAIVRLGYKLPTNTQRACIPLAQGRINFSAIVELESGKTGAMVVPLVDRFREREPATAKKFLGLILTPSENATLKLCSDTKQYCKHVGLRCIALTDDNDVLAHGAEILVSTPTHFKAAIEDGAVDFSELLSFNLTHLDSMIENGDLANINKILEHLPEEREADQDKLHMCYYSTNSSSKLTKLCEASLGREFVSVIVGEGHQGKGKRTITQRVEWIGAEAEQHARLLQLIQNSEGSTVIICTHKRTCDSLLDTTAEIGVSATVLHGAKSAEQLDNNVAGFLEGKYRIVIITNDMLQRVKVSGVRQVINYNMPSTIEKYLARVGILGIDGGRGVITSFIAEKDSALFYEFRRLLKECKQDIPRKLSQHPASRKPEKR